MRQVEATAQPTPADEPEAEFLRLKSVMRRTGLGRSTIRLRVWRVTGVAFGLASTERCTAQRRARRLDRQAGLVHAQREGKAGPAIPGHGKGRHVMSAGFAGPTVFASGMEARQGARRRYPGGSMRSTTARPRAAGRRRCLQPLSARPPAPPAHTEALSVLTVSRDDRAPGGSFDESNTPSGRGA